MYKITEECIGCGLCQSNCPVSAIFMGDGIRVIDQDTCIACGSCYGPERYAASGAGGNR